MLTADVDDLTGTANDDAFSAPLTVAGSETLNSFDTIDGGEGTDSLTATLTNAQGTAAPTLENVENLFIRSVTAANTLDLQNSEGFEQLWSNGSQQNMLFTNVGEQVTVGARNIASNVVNDLVSVAYDANTVAAADTQAIVLEDADVSMDISQNGGATGVRNVTIASNGSANVVDFVNTALVTGGVIQNLTITGSGDLEIDSSDVITAGTVDASEATGDLDLTVSAPGAANLATGVTARSVTLGSGDDSLNAVAGIGAGSYEGGEGRDTIVVDGTSGSLVNDLIANVSGFEVLNLGNAFNLTGAAAISYATMENIGFESIVVTDSNAGNGQITNLTADSNITLVNTDGTGDQLDLVVAGAANNDNAEFTLATQGARGNDSTFTLTIDDVENVNVSTADAQDNVFQTSTVAFASADALENLTITGDEAVVFDGSAIATLETVDVSGVTAASDRDNGEFAATVTVDNATVTGTAEADAIFFGAGADITGGAGDDALFSDNTNNTNQTFASITGFAAGDTIVFGDADQTVGTGDLVVDTAATLGAGSAALEEITVSVAPGQTASFGDYLEQAFGADNMTAGDLADGEVGFFEFDGNTYIVANNTGGAGTAAYANPASGEAAVTGDLIQLTGSVDLSDFAYETLA